MERISVAGSSGSGKSTVARVLAARLGLPYVEFDALFWEPGWREADRTTFRDRVRAAIEGDRWVADGNYSTVRDLVLPRADTLVWLDLPYPLVVGRTVRRTVARARSHEQLWSGNVESWRKSLGRNSLIWWVIRTHHSRRRRWEVWLRRPDVQHLRVVRLRSARAVDRWLETVG